MPYCTRCGNEVAAGASFCTKCGQSLGGGPLTPAQPQTQSTPLVGGAGYATVRAPWGGALLLQSGEGVVRYWGADREVTRMGIVNGNSQMIKRRLGGYLVLTTQRLAFVQERGVFGKSYHVDLSFPIDSLGGLSMGGLVMKYVSISDSQGEHIFHVSGVKNEAEFAGFQKLIQDQLIRRQQEVEAARRRERVQITLDFGFLRDYMSKGGLSLQVVKCPSCGASLSLPKEGSQVTCTHCGSTVFAQDIMERVKQLIG